MCRRILLSLWVALSAVAAYGLPIYAPLPEERLLLLRWAPPVMTLLIAALLSLPEKEGSRLSQLRPLPSAALQGGGALLLAFSGAHQLYLLYPMLRSLAALAAAALILAGIGLFGGMKACEGGETKAGSLLLLPLAAALLHLIRSHFDNATDPGLRGYDMRVLFTVAAAVSIALLTEFVFTEGHRRLTIAALSLTVTFAGGALHMTETAAQSEGVIGAAVAAFGFLLSLLFGFERPTRVQYELVEDPFSTGRIRARQEMPADEGSSEALAAESAAEPSPLPVKESATAAAAEKTVPTAAAEKSVLTPNKGAPAPTPAKPETSDDFDLARVDQLLLELGLDTEL